MVTWNKPPAIAGQLDRCDVCGDKYHRGDLVRTQVEFLDMKSENYVGTSSYDSDYWSVDDASDVTSTTVGTYGKRCDDVRLSLGDDNTLTYINSPKVWEGNGTVRMDNATGSFSDSSDLTFSVVVGPHEQNTSPSMTVAVGLTNAAGDSKQVLRTWTDIKTMTRVWANEEVLTMNTYGLGQGSYRFYFQVTNDGKWWWDEAQIEANVNSLPNETAGTPENFVRATGSNVSNQSERQLITQRKVCPNCVEYVLSKSERFGRTDESPVDEPVDTLSQEF